MVNRGAKTDAECRGSGRYAKRDLLTLHLVSHWLLSPVKPYGMREMYQIRERIQLLAHHRRLLSPSSDLAVHEVEEESERHKPQGCPEVCEIVGIAKAIAH